MARWWLRRREGGENFLVGCGARSADWGGGLWEGLAGSGFGVEGGRVFLPDSFGVDGVVGGVDGAVEFFVGEF